MQVPTAPPQDNHNLISSKFYSSKDQSHKGNVCCLDNRYGKWRMAEGEQVDMGGVSSLKLFCWY